MESDTENWRWWLWRDLRRYRPCDEGAGGPQARVCQAAQAGAQDGSGRAEEAAGSGPCMQVHWLWKK